MRISFLLFALAFAAQSLAQPTQPANDVDKLVGQLSSENWQERQTAQERLVQLGDEAVAALNKLLAATNDPEARSLAETALAQIEQNRLVGASIITIRAEKILPRELFKQLAEQAGTKLDPMPPNLFSSMRQDRVSVDIDHLPFWSAMNQLTAKTGVTLVNWNNQMMLTTGQSAVQGPSVISGPYMVIAGSVSRSRSVDLASNASTRQFHVQLTVMAEPKLRMIRAAGGAKVEQAVDENGTSLAPPASNAPDYGFYTQMGNTWQATATLNDPESIGKRIASLRGTIQAVICTRMDRLDIPDIMGAKNVEKSLDGARVTIVDVTRKNDSYEVRIRAQLLGADRDWSRLPVNDIRLLDARGNALQTRGSSASVIDDAYELTLQFSAVPANGQGLTEPANLVWDIPLETRPIEIPFEFKDLPIP